MGLILLESTYIVCSPFRHINQHFLSFFCAHKLLKSTNRSFFFHLLLGFLCYDFAVGSIFLRSHHQRSYILKCDSTEEMPSCCNYFDQILDISINSSTINIISSIFNGGFLGFHYYIIIMNREDFLTEAYFLFSFLLNIIRIKI